MRFIDDLSHALKTFIKKEVAASPVEYALIGGLVVVVCALLTLALIKS